MAKTKQIFIFLSRFFAMCAAISATIIMATSHETTTVLNLSFEAKYDHSPANKYFVIANAIAAVYTLFVLFLHSESWHLRMVVALDVIITLLLTSSIAAALAIAYVGKKGNFHAGWLPVCDQVPKFCNQLTGALVAGSIALLIYVVLLLHSICTVLNPLV